MFIDLKNMKFVDFEQNNVYVISDCEKSNNNNK